MKVIIKENYDATSVVYLSGHTHLFKWTVTLEILSKTGTTSMVVWATAKTYTTKLSTLQTLWV